VTTGTESDRAGEGHLNVALSMLTLVPGEMGGTETYARAITRELVGVENFSATAYVPATAAGFSGGIPETVIPSVRVTASTAGRLAGVGRAILNGRAIRGAMSSESVVHYPFTVPVPRPLRRQAMVQTLHDVQHLDLPQLFSRGERGYRRRFYDEAAKRADVVITISEFAKGRIVESLGIAPDRVVVAHLGVDTAAFVPNSGVRENFVLYPARGWEHKNHRRLIAAMEILRTRIPGIRLVLTGGALESLGELPDWVDRRGLVSAEELRGLYRSASALAFPSLYEGFGLPPLEAMASGCPAAVSNAGSIPEVCGSAAVLFDPLDAAAIADGIEEAIGRREELSALGAEQVAQFTWKRCAEAHLTAYRLASAVH
jgi:glycosyltransferase involved in cell wall biosynthesis